MLLKNPQESFEKTQDVDEMAQAVEEAMAAKESADKCNDKADMRKPQDQENVDKADQAAMDAINSAEDAVEEAETGEFPQIDKEAADSLREMLNEAFEEVEQRKQGPRRITTDFQRKPKIKPSKVKPTKATWLRNRL